MQHMHQHDQQWYDALHIIMWPYWFIDLDLTCSSPLCRSIGSKSCPSFTVTRGPSLRSLRLALHICNRSIKPSLLSIFSTLVTWLNVMSHVQWAPSSHVWALQHLKPFHLHGQTCTCGLITYVSLINTISPHKVVTQLPKPNKDLSPLCDSLSISRLPRTFKLQLITESYNIRVHK
jgi:hypothetical protein